MNLNEAFAELLNANEPKNDEIEKSVKALVDKLDSVYYCSNCGCHYVISGSYGRGTQRKIVTLMFAIFFRMRITIDFAVEKGIFSHNYYQKLKIIWMKDIRTQSLKEMGRS